MSESSDGASKGAPAVTRLRVEQAPVHALAALLSDDLPVPGPGDPLPPLWHWAALSRWHSFAANGVDGHAKTGGFLPDLGKPRRMWVGGRVSFHAPLVVDDLVWQEDEVHAVTPKSGSQGDFFLVEVRTRIYDSSRVLAIEETRNIIYRDAAASVQAAAIAPDPSSRVSSVLSSEGGRWSFTTDPAVLMRFSSATSNGHRIHYDHPYATRVEGYPGLVVHGPLMTIALARALRHQYPEAQPMTLQHRNLRPLFSGETAQVEFEDHGDGRVDVSLVREAATRVRLNAEF